LGGVSRVVKPELLDELAFDDPDARRSRRELEWINALMGNFRWIRRELAAVGVTRVLELGASTGALLTTLQSTGRELVGFDLAPRPEDLPGGISWVQGDVRAVFAEALDGATVVVANHLLHQFSDDDLRRMGAALSGCDGIVACEPLRATRTRVLGVSLWPMLNRVTRADMLVSIRAGFRRGELPALLGLDRACWEIAERCTWRGAYRLSARRRSR
jgi:hypothetical protein